VTYNNNVNNRVTGLVKGYLMSLLDPPVLRRHCARGEYDTKLHIYIYNAPVNVLQDLIVQVLEFGVVGRGAAGENGLPLVIQTVDT
jgi:hypothetical protein